MNQHTSKRKRILETRPIFCEANPSQEALYLKAQKAFFAAGRKAGLSEDRDDQIEGINAALGLRGTQRIISRTQVTPAEYQALVVAIEAGLFSKDFAWGNEFRIVVERHVIEHASIVPNVTADDASRFNDLLNGMSF